MKPTTSNCVTETSSAFARPRVGVTSQLRPRCAAKVEHPGSYGIRPGERLSSVLERAGGFSPQAYPYGAVLMRREVRDIEMKSHLALVQRIKAEQVNLKGLLK